MAMCSRVSTTYSYRITGNLKIHYSPRQSRTRFTGNLITEKACAPGALAITYIRLWAFRVSVARTRQVRHKEVVIAGAFEVTVR